MMMYRDSEIAPTIMMYRDSEIAPTMMCLDSEIAPTIMMCLDSEIVPTIMMCLDSEIAPTRESNDSGFTVYFLQAVARFPLKVARSVRILSSHQHAVHLVPD